MTEFDSLSHLESGPSKFVVLTRPGLGAGWEGREIPKQMGKQPVDSCCGPLLPSAGPLQVGQDLGAAVGDEQLWMVRSQPMASLFAFRPELGRSLHNSLAGDAARQKHVCFQQL